MGTGAGDAIEDEEVPLAVIIADSFDNSFEPLSLTKPQVLSPLANVPLIEYTLGALKDAGIENAIVYCKSHAQAIREYLGKSQWMTEMTINVVSNEESESVGDALRDLDSKQIITTDFILIFADLVSNIDFKQVLEKHKSIKRSDKEAIMTRVTMKVPPVNRHNTDDVNMYALNKDTNQILYMNTARSRSSSADVKFPIELLREHKQMSIRTDLHDSNITVCAAAVPSILTDNFDYLSMDDLIHGVLGNQEIHGHTMHVHEIERGYAARTSSMKMYSTITMDVLENWAQLSNPSRRKGSQYHYSFGNKYVTDHVHRSPKSGRNVMIGSDTKIDETSCLTHSVIGNNCQIGKNVRIVNSIIWDRVTIEDNCVIENALIADDVVLFKKTNIIRSELNKHLQYIIAEKVKLGPSVTLNKPVRLSAQPQTSEWNEEVKPYACGSGGLAYEYVLSEDEFSDEEGDHMQKSDGSDFSDGEDRVIPDTELFTNELMETLERATTEKVSADNIVLDINSLKHAYNIQINEVNHMLIQSVLDFPLHSKQDVTTPSQLLNALKPVLRTCVGVFKNYYRSEQSQMECLNAIQEYCTDTTHTLIIPILCQLFKFFYDNDILDEEIICTWHSELESCTMKTELQKIVDWLGESEEESD